MQIENQTTFKGPEGIRQRMSEIQARMAQVFPDMMEKAQNAPPALSGSIGTAPLDPFGPGMKVSGGATPEMQAMIQRAASANGLDPALLDSVVQAESGYDPSARSRVGALGLTQLMPGTATQMGVQNPLDPEQNLMGGAKYLRTLVDKFGDLNHAVAAYNAGPGAVLRNGGIPPYPETQKYVSRVMALYNARKGL